MRFRLIFGAICAILLADATTSRGQAIWTGAGLDNLWTTGTNWRGGTPPASGSDAVLTYAVGNRAVSLNTTVSLNSLLVGDPSPYIDYNYGYHFQSFQVNSAGPVTLNVGTGGISTSNILAHFGSQIAVNLTTPQTWDTGDDYYDPIRIDGPLSNNGFTLTKAGYGELILNNGNTLSGTVNLDYGLLTLGNNNALGTATLNVRYQGTLQGTGNLTLTNPVVIGSELDFRTYHGTTTLAGAVSVPAVAYGYIDVEGPNPVTISGPVTLGSTLELSINEASTLILTGTLSASAAQPVYLYNSGTVLMNGTVNPNAVSNYDVYDGKLIFGSAAALPSGTTTITAHGTDYAYYSTGYAGLGVGSVSAASFLAGFNKPGTKGTVGFDNGITVAGPVDLTGFDAAAKLGSATTAALGAAATITPQATSYNFGGGGGVLTVSSNLGGANSLFVRSPYSQPLTLVLNGTNSFTGGGLIDSSVLKFDSATAFPATGIFTVPAPGNAPNYYTGFGYVGFGYAGVDLSSPAASTALASRFLVPASSVLVLGFDTPGAGSIAGTVDLSGFPQTTYLGTSTTLTLSGPIVPAAGGSLYQFAAVKDGRLTVASNLSGTGGALIGLPLNIDTFPYPTEYVVDAPYNSDYLRNLDNGVVDFSDARSTVTLTGNNSAMSGIVNLQGGRLEVGNNQALGTGTLGVNGFSILASVGSGLVIPNTVSIQYTLGLDSSANNFTLSGSVGGNSLVKLGVGTVNLTGPVNINGYVRTQQGSLDVAGSGFTAGEFYVNSAGTVNFHTALTAVQYLYGDPGAVINLDPGTILEVGYGGYYAGTIAGAGGLAFTNTGSLELASANTYTAGTTINNGQIVARVNGALGTGPVQIANNGSLGLGRGVTLTNSLTFTNGMIGGNGVFAPSNGPITVGLGRIVAPGLDDQYGSYASEGGTLGFASGLTLASNGAYLWNILDAGHVPGGGWSLLDISGPLAITSTTGAPFTIVLNAGGYYYYDYTYITNFNPNLPYSWVIAQAAGGITGFNGTNIVLDTTSFDTLFTARPLASFSLSQSGNNLVLNFSPVPEPSTYALLALGLAAVVLGARRRRAR